MLTVAYVPIADLDNYVFRHKGRALCGTAKLLKYQINN